MPKNQSILVISDLHVPFEHPDTVPFLKAVKSQFKPTDVVQIGDEADFHALSFHDSDPDLPSAGEELEKAIAKLQPIYKLFPKVTVRQIKEIKKTDTAQNNIPIVRYIDGIRATVPTITYFNDFPKFGMI